MRLLKAINLMRDGILILKQDSLIKELNLTAERLLGHTSSQIKDAGILSIPNEIRKLVDIAIETRNFQAELVLFEKIYVLTKVYIDKSAVKWGEHQKLNIKHEIIVELEDVTEYIPPKQMINGGLPLKSEEVYELIYQDYLTSLFNRRYFDEKLPHLLESTMFNETSISLLLIDVDDFKNVNDRHGHQIGDLALKAVAGFMKKNSRKDDMACRLGGDEFSLIMINVSEKVVLQRAEKLCKEISKYKFGNLNKFENITVSIGITTFPKQAITLTQLIKFSDMALYRAKLDGRNCIRVYDPNLDVIKKLKKPQNP